MIKFNVSLVHWFCTDGRSGNQFEYGLVYELLSFRLHCLTRTFDDWPGLRSHGDLELVVI